MEEDTVHYNPQVPPETRIITTFNVTNASNDTRVCGSSTTNIYEIEIDGVVQPLVQQTYSVYQTTWSNLSSRIQAIV